LIQENRYFFLITGKYKSPNSIEIQGFVSFCFLLLWYHQHYENHITKPLFSNAYPKTLIDRGTQGEQKHIFKSISFIFHCKVGHTPATDEATHKPKRMKSPTQPPAASLQSIAPMRGLAQLWRLL